MQVPHQRDARPPQSPFRNPDPFPSSICEVIGATNHGSVFMKIGGIEPTGRMGEAPKFGHFKGSTGVGFRDLRALGDDPMVAAVREKVAEVFGSGRKDNRVARGGERLVATILAGKPTG